MTKRVQNKLSDVGIKQCKIGSKILLEVGKERCKRLLKKFDTPLLGERGGCVVVEYSRKLKEGS